MWRLYECYPNSEKSDKYLIECYTIDEVINYVRNYCDERYRLTFEDLSTRIDLEFINFITTAIHNINGEEIKYKLSYFNPNSKWNLYVFNDCGLDSEPEFIRGVESIDEAVKYCKWNAEEAHRLCPNECCSYDEYIQGVNYEDRYKYKNIFFKIPDDMDNRGVINISWCNDGETEFYIEKIDNIGGDDSNDEE